MKDKEHIYQSPGGPKTKLPETRKKEDTEPIEDVEEKSPAIKPVQPKSQDKKEQQIVNEQEQDKITNDTPSTSIDDEEEK